MNKRDGDIADRVLTKENVAELLAKLTLPEMVKRTRRCEDIHALTALINACLEASRRAPLWGNDWRYGHFSRPQLDELTELASDQIDTINKKHLAKLRSRSFLDNLLPQNKVQNDGQARQSSFRRKRRWRKLASDDSE